MLLLPAIRQYQDGGGWVVDGIGSCCSQWGNCTLHVIAIWLYRSKVMHHVCLQAVTFLKRIKEVIEDPRRMLLDC